MTHNKKCHLVETCDTNFYKKKLRTKIENKKLRVTEIRMKYLEGLQM
jgi:hypothetical protein